MAEILHFPRRTRFAAAEPDSTVNRALQTAENALIDVVASIMTCPDDRHERLRCISYAQHRIKLASLCLDIAKMTEIAEETK